MSKKSFSSKVFTVLDHKLMKLDKQKHEKGLLTSDVHFTRAPRKLDFIEDMKILLACGAASMKKELYEYFDYDVDTVSLPGFIRSRAKIKEEAFKELMDVMNKAYPCDKKYMGYRLLSVDGCDLTIPTDRNDKETYEQYINERGFNNYHLNCLFDLMNHRYIDNITQTLKKKNEIEAMWTMAESYDGDKAIFIADRGYESFNNLEHLKKTDHKFLIRVKDIGSGTSLLKSFKSLPKQGEFDKDVHIIFTNRKTNFIRNNPEIYKTIMSNQRFDFLDKENHFYDADYRAVRIKIDGSDEKYESLITNLDRKLFPASKIKELYRMRWDIEVSYRHLKYSVELNALHCKRRDFIRQEIWARLVMFNISMIIIDYVTDHKLSKKERRLEYKTNITMAVFFTKHFMIIRKGGDPPDLECLIAKEILPVRDDRHYERNVRPQGFVSFGYRFN